jgi:hypothetical protein
MDGWKKEFLPSDSIHLFSNYSNYLQAHALAERQQRIDAGSKLAHIPGPHQQAVAGDFRISGVFA